MTHTKSYAHIHTYTTLALNEPRRRTSNLLIIQTSPLSQRTHNPKVLNGKSAFHVNQCNLKRLFHAPERFHNNFNVFSLGERASRRIFEREIRFQLIEIEAFDGKCTAIGGAVLTEASDSWKFLIESNWRACVKVKTEVWFANDEGLLRYRNV